VSALLLTSAFEGFGMTLVEAMSYGIYCISSDCPSGPADIVREGVNGKLYAPGDLPAFRERLREVMNVGVPTAQALIKESIRKFYVENYFRSFRSALFRPVRAI
jgi:UDP-D-galactose:(glucosyl)LPS alpha-1,6-D-galactosyltransferase